MKFKIHKICTKDAKYAAPHDYAPYLKICKNIQKISKYLQDMST